MKSFYRRAFLFAGLAALSTLACAQGYPNRPLKYIVPFPPGGPTDTFSRPLAARLAQLLGQPVVIENVPGAAGLIGMDRVAKSAADGYTIGLATTGTHAMSPAVYGAKMPFNALEDFTPLSLTVSYVNILVVHPSVPVRNAAELIAFAKANPGKVNYGSCGNGCSTHLAAEALRSLTGAPMLHVPYKGSAPALVDLVAGRLTFMFDQPISLDRWIKDGRVRALAVTGAGRSPYLPEIPTLEESGVPGYPEMSSDLWYGIVGPAGIAKPIADRLNAELARALRAPEMAGILKTQFFNVLPSTREEFQKVIKVDHGKWGKIVKDANATID